MNKSYFIKTEIIYDLNIYIYIYTYYFKKKTIFGHIKIINLFIIYVILLFYMYVCMYVYWMVGWLVYGVSTLFGSFNAELSHFDKSFKYFRCV